MPLRAQTEESHILPTMSDAPGCSKCRYSKRGCARCRDPAFKERQRVKAAGKVQPKKPSLSISRARKRSAEAPKEDIKPIKAKRPRKAKHTSDQAEEGLQSGALAPGAKRQHKQTTQASPAVAPETDVTQNRHSDHKASSSCQAHALGHMDAPLQPSTDQSRITPTDGGDMPAKEATNVASGLELGLMAGLLPLQQEAGSAVHEKQAVEAVPSTSRDLDGRPASERHRSAVEELQHSKPKQSTSQQSKDVSQTSTGMQCHAAPIYLCVCCHATEGTLPGSLSSPFGICFKSSSSSRFGDKSVEEL